MPQSQYATGTGQTQRLDQCEAYPYRWREYAGRLAWEWVDRLLMRHSPRRAERWRVFWLSRFGAKIDRPSSVKPGVKIVHPWLFTLGAHSSLAQGTTVYNLGTVTIGSHTVVSQGVYICAGTHAYTKPDLPLQKPPVVIGSGVWVCAGAFIGPGVTIGDNAVIGAHAVVIKDVPAGAIVAGNPAKIVKHRPMSSEARSEPTRPTTEALKPVKSTAKG